MAEEANLWTTSRAMRGHFLCRNRAEAAIGVGRGLCRGRKEPLNIIMSLEKDSDELSNAILQPDGRLLVILEPNDPHDPYTWSKTK
jgi:hypothetical protein